MRVLDVRMIIRWVFAVLAAVIAAVMMACTVVIVRFDLPAWFVRFSYVVSNYGLYLIPLGLVGIGLTGLARMRAGQALRWTAAGIALLCVAGMVVACVPVVASWREAHRNGASLSIVDYFTGRSNTGSPVERLSTAYNTIDGTDLLLDVKLPSGTPARPRPAVVWVHGGGWAEGNRGEAPKWHEWLNDKGYAVFAIEYRMTPPPRWDQAPADVKCAVGWVKQHAQQYSIDPDRVMLAGGSAGGNLALMGAYSDERISPSCAVTDTSVRAVAAFYPATDLAAAWRDPLLLTGIRDDVQNYIGGTPDQYPDRYAAASPITYVRPGLPPTLLMHGTRDHVVPEAQSITLAEKLAATAIDHDLLLIPYGEHVYDFTWGDWGTQISRHVFAEFLTRHFPAS
ncbi:alpha/beta hydrolase [Nocardia sp. NPDC051030]|uniref:alpha/beta hydrolase n=1 Tax=Nocardia sp. NPDC051030 TaxID=3155162 RepID=UPI00342F9401